MAKPYFPHQAGPTLCAGIVFEEDRRTVLYWANFCQNCGQLISAVPALAQKEIYLLSYLEATSPQRDALCLSGEERNWLKEKEKKERVELVQKGGKK